MDLGIGLPSAVPEASGEELTGLARRAEVAKPEQADLLADAPGK